MLGHKRLDLGFGKTLEVKKSELSKKGLRSLYKALEFLASHDFRGRVEAGALTQLGCRNNQQASASRARIVLVKPRTRVVHLAGFMLVESGSSFASRAP